MIKVLTLLLGCFALASSIKHRRIRFGDTVTQEQLMANFQFVVSILLNCDKKDRCELCAGSLIKSDEVLLSAHCFCDEKGDFIDFGKDIYVFFNSTVVKRGRMVYGYLGKIKPEFSCRKMLIFNMANFQSNYDLATIRLEEEVTDIVPVTLLDQPRAREINMEVTFLGYGLDENNVSINLKMGIRSTRLCDPSGTHPMVTGIYCVDGNVQGRPSPSVGDSGGPLLFRNATIRPYGYLQLGVTQGGLDLSTTECDDEGEQRTFIDTIRVFVKVPQNYNWIYSEDSYANIDVEERKRRRKRRKKRCCLS